MLVGDEFVRIKQITGLPDAVFQTCYNQPFHDCLAGIRHRHPELHEPLICVKQAFIMKLLLLRRTLILPRSHAGKDFYSGKDAWTFAGFMLGLAHGHHDCLSAEAGVLEQALSDKKMTWPMLFSSSSSDYEIMLQWLSPESRGWLDTHGCLASLQTVLSGKPDPDLGGLLQAFMKKNEKTLSDRNGPYALPVNQSVAVETNQAKSTGLVWPSNRVVAEYFLTWLLKKLQSPKGPGALCADAVPEGLMMEAAKAFALFEKETHYSGEAAKKGLSKLEHFYANEQGHRIFSFVVGDKKKACIILKKERVPDWEKSEHERNLQDL